MEWPGRLEIEEDSVMTCGRLDVIFELSTDRKIMCREELAQFCIITQEQLEKKLYEPFKKAGTIILLPSY